MVAICKDFIDMPFHPHSAGQLTFRNRMNIRSTSKDEGYPEAGHIRTSMHFLG